MKYLEYPELDKLSQLLNKDMGDYVLNGKIEAYSCKLAGTDKKLYKQLMSTSYKEEQGDEDDLKDFGSTPPSAMYFTPSTDPLTERNAQPYRSLSEPEGRHILIYFISVLNASFPDYDFSDLRGDSFSVEENLEAVLSSIDTHLSHVISDYYKEFRPQLLEVMTEIIAPRECQLYSFKPDASNDPFDAIWSFNYFFYNGKLKRVVFFNFQALPRPVLGDKAESFEDELIPGMEMEL